MAGEAELERWWDGLTEQERADAARSAEGGGLSEAMRASLEAAGVLDPSAREDRVIPGRIRDFIKTRH